MSIAFIPVGARLTVAARAQLAAFGWLGHALPDLGSRPERAAVCRVTF